MGIDRDTCEKVLGEFDSIAPYIKQLNEAAAATARNRGYIRTLLGRRRRFNLWAPKGSGKDEPALPHNQAKEKWPEEILERAYVYKAFNALIQGSAADQTKKALIDITRAVGLPQMTVHDEISKSVQSEKEAEIMRECMVGAIPLLAPVRADLDLGGHWV